MSDARETLFSTGSAEIYFYFIYFYNEYKPFCSVPCKPEGRYKIYISFALPNGWKGVKSGLKKSRLDVGFRVAAGHVPMYERTMQYFILQERMRIDEE